MRCLIPLLLALASPVAAETGPLDAAGFEAYTQGRTLSFGSQGAEPYGMERYLSGRRVIWTFLDGQCDNGVWYEQDDSICFTYDFDPTPQCWQFFVQDDGLLAIFMNDPGTTVLYEVQDNAGDLICGGLGA